MSKILVVATSRKTRGGITSVVKAYEQSKQWEEYHCKWIETHIDRGILWKLLYLFTAFSKFCFLVPFYDCVHIHHAELHREILFFVLAKLWRKKTILHLHACYPETTINGPRKKLFYWAFSHSDRVLVLSEQWKRMVEDYLDLSDNLEVLYNPCPLISKDSRLFAKDIPYVLFAGTVCERKGYHVLISAFARVSNLYPQWKLVIVGNGEIDKGLELAKRSGIEDRVEFRGWVSGCDKDKAFYQAEVYCLPSFAEGFPMGVLDAWGYGLPVVTTPVGGIPDILKHGENGLLFTVGDVVALSVQLERIMGDVDLRNKIKQQSIRLAKNTFSVEEITRKLGIIYNQVLNG